MPKITPDIENFAKIKVVGVGGAGGNAVTRMMDFQIHGIELIAINTDAQDLHFTKANQKIHVGKNSTRGLGAGMNPALGAEAAEENRAEIIEALKGADMVFVTCGMGGGTGTGASPIVAEIAKESGALTVGVVTKPFSFEGAQRARIADQGWHKLKERVDAIITVPNDRIFNLIERGTPILQAFSYIDEILRQGIQGISDLITHPGIINVDFADVKVVMKDAGSALMGIGIASGDDRAPNAAKSAISSPLLDISIDGAKGVLFNVIGGPDLSLIEINDAAKVITESIDTDAKVIFGATHDERMKKGELRITVIATGFQNGGNIASDDKKSSDYNEDSSDSGNASGKEEDWTIPSFLRKKR